MALRINLLGTYILSAHNNYMYIYIYIYDPIMYSYPYRYNIMLSFLKIYNATKNISLTIIYKQTQQH